MPDAGVLAGLALLGGVVALDETALGQFMLSRPLVAATLAGAAAGDPAAGALAGAALEAVHLSVLPVGAARYPEGGPPAVIAGAAAGGVGAPGLLLVVLFALVWESVSGASVQLLRRLNVRVVSSPRASEPGTLERRHLAAMGLELLRGGLVTAVGWTLLAALLALDPVPRPDAGVAGLALWSVAAAGCAAALRLFGSRHMRWFLAGAGCAAAAVVLL